MSSSLETRLTVRGDASATWFVRDGVIHVLSVRLPDGTETELPDAPSLGECFGLMPRKLRDGVRYEYESPTYSARWSAVSGNASPREGEIDVHLSVQLHDVRMDFAACLTAALTFMQDWRSRHCPDAVTVIPGGTDGLPRLPNERLYLEL